MHKINKIKKRNALEAGVTLLLAILVLSSVMAVSVSLATIMFVEVRSSGDLLRTETAYYGADAAIEQAIYKVKRSVPTSGCDNSLPNCYSSGVGSVNLNNIPPTENNLTDPIVQDTVPSGSLDTNGNFPSSAKRYTLYDPTCPSPNAGSTNLQCQHGGSGYSKITLTYLNSGSTDHVKVYICQFDPTFSVNLTGGALDSNQYSSVPCSQPNFYGSPNYWLVQAFDFYPGISNTYCSASTNSCTWNLDSTKQQELIIFDPTSGGALTPYVQLQAYDTSSLAKGVPYFQEEAVDINAQTAGINRKVRVIVPTGSSNGGTSSTSCNTPVSNAFNACYYTGMTLSNLVLNRTDSYPLPFNWGTGSPDPSVPFDQFSASWTGSFTFSGGSYTFSATSDDGVRLYIDGVKVIDAWVDQPATTYTYTTFLNGIHTIRMEYYEDGGGAVAQLSWSMAPDTVWVEDSLPAGSSPASDGGDNWTWVGSSPAPYSGSLASQSNITSGEHQHYFTGASSPLSISATQNMIVYVYLDPSNPPTEIELQWNSLSQGWSHRAFWNNTGNDIIGWGSQGTQSLQYMGNLPATGQWVRLVVPASSVGLSGLQVGGMAFTVYGGRATWDHAGTNP